MTPDRWSRTKEILEAAWEMEAGSRAAFLDQACAADPELRAHVQSLLESDEAATGFLAEPAVDMEAVLGDGAGDESPELTGTRIGRYTIQNLIGKGGMGAVYRAVREDDFRMEVAIKLLKRGTDTDATLGRFRNERQILAGLQHPNIARLLDGGATEAGLPYLVMEYVDGTPLLQYASSLPVRQRLELFRSVCAAVQYAHEKLIVHRDIKPANILLTSDGIPKLLDFGIAKLLDPADQGATAALTMTGMRLMTPDYASPEQVLGQSITPATDVYALGAVLYELLTGERAHHIQSYSAGEIEKEICICEPRRPGALVKGLDADLDNIVLKALRKEPERRYASAQELSDDLERFLLDQPVKARAETAAYRGRKFLKRNRTQIAIVAISVLLGVGLVAGLNRLTTPGGSANPGTQSKDQRWQQFSFEKIATLGDPAPGGGVFMKAFAPVALNHLGDLLFDSWTSEAETGVFLWKRDLRPALLPLIRTGDRAPGAESFHQDVAGYTITGSGDIAIGFELKYAHPPDLKGFGSYGIYRYSPANGRLTPAVIPGVTPAPGFGIFLSAGNSRLILNNSGDMVFAGIVHTPPGASRSADVGEGIFRMDRDGRVTKIVVPGDPAPGGGKFDFAQNPWMNDQGDIAFGAHIAGEECIGDGTIACFESVYLRSAATGSLQSIAHQGERGPLSTPYRYAWGPIINNRGEILFIGEIVPMAGVRATRGVFLYSGGATIPIALPGDIMPDGRKILTTVPGHVIHNYSLNNRGYVCFNASLENGDSAFYVYSQGRLHYFAGTGRVIPGVGTISSVGSFFVNGGILNDGGQILFWATLTDGKGVLLLATPRSAASQSTAPF